MDAIASLEAARDEYTDAIFRLTESVADARDAGCSWAEIGKVFGVTKQGAQQQWARPVADVVAGRTRQKR